MPTYNEIYKSLASAYSRLRYVPDQRYHIKKVIFNNPATIIIWFDGSKTVVKCGERDVYDPEKGMAMAIAKRFLGDKGNYYEVFKTWLSEGYENIPKKKEKMKKKSELTVKEYAEKYGVSVRTVYRMIKADKVEAKKDSAGKWLIYGD